MALMAIVRALWWRSCSDTCGRSAHCSHNTRLAETLDPVFTPKLKGNSHYFNNCIICVDVFRFKYGVGLHPRRSQANMAGGPRSVIFIQPGEADEPALFAVIQTIAVLIPTVR